MPMLGASGYATLISTYQPSRPSEDNISSLYYDFEGARITLDVHICDANSVLSEDFSLRAGVLKSPASYQWPLAFDFYADSEGDKLSNTSQAHLGLLFESRATHTSGDERKECRPIGLCFIPGVEFSTWRRVGLWVLAYNVEYLQYMRMRTQEEDIFLSEFQPAFRSTFPFVVEGVITERVILV